MRSSSISASSSSTRPLPTWGRFAGVLLQLGERDRAVAMMRSGCERRPFDFATWRRLSDLARAERNYDEAIAQLRHILEICPEDNATIFAIADLHGMKGERDRQLAMLRAGLELNPAAKVQQRQLEFLAAEETPFFTAHEVEGAEILERDSGPPADAAEKNLPYHKIWAQTVVRSYRDGTRSEYEHRIVRILNDAGAQQWSRFGVPYSYGEQRARLLEAKIVRADGSVMRPRIRRHERELPVARHGRCR